MMKRKFLAVVLPIIGCATVVGSGFSAWYFGQTTNEKGEGGFGVNISITEEVKDASNSLTVSDDVDDFNGYKLLLDQGGYANKDNLDSGIMFTNSNPLPAQVSTTTTADWNFTVTYNSTNTTIKELYEAGLQIRFEFNIKLAGNLNTYIEVKNDALVGITSTTGSLDAKLPKFDTKDGGATYTSQFVIEGSELDTANAVYAFTLDMDTTDKTIFKNALFKYKQKPSDHDSYEAMTTAISGANITFEVIAHLEEVSAGA